MELLMESKTVDQMLAMATVSSGYSVAMSQPIA